MSKITLSELVERKRKNKKIITEKEAEDIFLIIPEGCVRKEVTVISNGLMSLAPVLNVKGLGEFWIK